MIRFFIGEDTYASYHQAKIFINQFDDYEVVDVDEIVDISEFANLLESNTLFAINKPLFVKRFSHNKKVTEYIESNISNLSQKNITFWDDKKINKNSTFYKLVSKMGLVEEFKELRNAELIEWVKQRAKKMGVEISSMGIKELLSATNRNRWIIDNELKKLRHIKEGQKLSDDSLIEILGLKNQGDIWHFIDMLSDKDKSRVILEYDRLIASGSDAHYFIAMLTRELSILSQVKYAEESGIIKSSIGLNPYVLEKASRKSYMYSLEKIHKLLRSLLNLDLAIKNGNANPELGLWLLLLSF